MCGDAEKIIKAHKQQPSAHVHSYFCILTRNIYEKWVIVEIKMNSCKYNVCGHIKSIYSRK